MNKNLGLISVKLVERYLFFVNGRWCSLSRGVHHVVIHVMEAKLDCDHLFFLENTQNMSLVGPSIHIHAPPSRFDASMRKLEVKANSPTA